MKPHPHNGPLQSGQAMIELMLGVILILILLTGSVQFLQVASAHSSIDGGVRARTGIKALSPLTEEDTPRYILNWDPGADGQRYTADDQATNGSPQTIVDIADRSVATATDWNKCGNLAHPSSLEALGQIPVPLSSLGFIGIRWSTLVQIEPIAQELFYGNAFATVQEDVWVPIMNGLY